MRTEREPGSGVPVPADAEGNQACVSTWADRDQRVQ